MAEQKSEIKFYTPEEMAKVRQEELIQENALINRIIPLRTEGMSVNEIAENLEIPLKEARRLCSTAPVCEAVDRMFKLGEQDAKLALAARARTIATSLSDLAERAEDEMVRFRSASDVLDRILPPQPVPKTTVNVTQQQVQAQKTETVGSIHELDRFLGLED